MKTISVHGIDEESEKLIRGRAKAEGRSVNKIVKELISNALGTGGSTKKKNKTDQYVDLCGIWSKEEAERFLEGISDLEAVDGEDWK